MAADLIKRHLHACLPRMILGCVNEYLAVDGTKQPRAERSLLAGAAGLRLLAYSCTPGQPQQTDCLPWDARNFTSSSKTRFCISLQNQIAFLSFTTIFSCLIPPSHIFFLNTGGQKKPCHSDRCRMLALWKSTGRDHCCSEDLAVWLGCYIGLYVMKPNFCFCK